MPVAAATSLPSSARLRSEGDGRRIRSSALITRIGEQARSCQAEATLRTHTT